MPELLVVRCGEVPYGVAREAQARLADARHGGLIPDVLLVLEHPPVYTRGRRADPAELPMGEGWYRARGIEVTDTDRGGRVTYHGPGQLVAYPIVSLRPYRDDIRDFIGRMERGMIAALGDWGVEARVIDDLTGVWTGGDPPPAGDARKIASIGIHVDRGVTTHGLAINVNNDLEPFEWIVPCGIDSVRMTSLAAELGAEQDLELFTGSVARRLGEVYGRRPVETPAVRLAELVAGAAGLVPRDAVPVP